MKRGRRISIFIAAVMIAASTALLTGCAGKADKNFAKLNVGTNEVPKVIEIEALEGFEIADAVDDFGVVLGATSDEKKTYIICDLLNGSAMKSENEIKRITDGLYFSKPDGESVTTTFYGRDGNGGIYKHSTGEEYDAVDDDYDDKIEFSDGKTLYVDENGYVKEADGAPKTLVTYSLADGMTETGDILYSFDGRTTLTIIGKSDRIVRNANLSEKFSVPGNGALGCVWAVGDNFFAQYRITLPFDAQRYDVFDGTNKYNLRTYSYNMSKDKARELKKFDMQVTDAQWSGEEYVILGGNKVKDGTLSGARIIQAYDGNGKIYTDLQKLMPGMNGIAFFGNKTFCRNASGDMSVYEGRNLVKAYRGEIDVNTISGPFFVTNSGAFDYHLKEVVKFDESSKLFDVRGNSIITQKGDGATFDVCTHIENYGGKIEKKHENVSLSEYAYACKSEAGGWGKFDVYDYSFTEPILTNVKADSADIETRQYRLYDDEALVIYTMTHDGKPVHYAAHYATIWR